MGVVFRVAVSNFVVGGWEAGESLVVWILLFDRSIKQISFNGESTKFDEMSPSGSMR
jgi:hypothetical protein